jgi:hypothetical protein
MIKFVLANGERHMQVGIYKIDRTMQIGSMRLVGERDFIVFAALAALYRYAHDSFVIYVLKKNLVAPTADVIDIAATFHSGTDK